MQGRPRIGANAAASPPAAKPERPCQAGGVPTARISDAPAARARRAIDTNPWRRVAIAACVEPVVDPDAAGPRERGASLAPVASDGDERPDPPRPEHDVGMSIGAFPRQGERQEARMSGRRLDDVAVVVGAGFRELDRMGGLHRAAPHVDRLREEAGDDRDRVESQVAADRRVFET